MSARATPQGMRGRCVAERRRRANETVGAVLWALLRYAAGLVESVVVRKGKNGAQQANAVVQSSAITPNRVGQQEAAIAGVQLRSDQTDSRMVTRHAVDWRRGIVIGVNGLARLTS
jgi:hypothetical protein